MVRNHYHVKMLCKLFDVSTVDGAVLFGWSSSTDIGRSPGSGAAEWFGKRQTAELRKLPTPSGSSRPKGHGLSFVITFGLSQLVIGVICAWSPSSVLPRSDAKSTRVSQPFLTSPELNGDRQLHQT